jgi:Sporulation and spore germination
VRSRALTGVALVLLMGACTVSTDGPPTQIADEAVPFSLLDPEAPPVTVEPEGRGFSICLLDEDLLTPATRQLAEDADLRDVVRSLGTLRPEEAALGWQTALSSPDDVQRVTLQAGTVTVDLTQNAQQAITSDPLATVAQLVCTLTAQPGVGRVEFSIDGTAIEVPRADGSLTDAPVTRDDYATLIGRASR